MHKFKVRTNSAGKGECPAIENEKERIKCVLNFLDYKSSDAFYFDYVL